MQKTDHLKTTATKKEQGQLYGKAWRHKDMDSSDALMVLDLNFNLAQSKKEISSFIRLFQSAFEETPAVLNVHPLWLRMGRGGYESYPGAGRC